MFVVTMTHSQILTSNHVHPGVHLDIITSQFLTRTHISVWIHRELLKKQIIFLHLLFITVPPELQPPPLNLQNLTV